MSMFDFDDIAEEAIADVVEQSQKEIEVERPEFDPDEIDGYQYMLMLVVNVNSSMHVYDKKEQHNFFRMLMSIMQTVSSDCTGDIIFHKYHTKECNSEITGKELPLPVVCTIYPNAQFNAWVSLIVKFSFRDDLSINARLSKLLRMFTGIQSFKGHVLYNPYKDEDFNPYSCYVLKNNSSGWWSPMQKDKINIKHIHQFFHDALNYDKTFNDKIVWYYKDFFMEKSDSNELLNPVNEELKQLMSLRWAIKIDANYLRQFGHIPRQSFAEKIMRQRKSQNSVCSV